MKTSPSSGKKSTASKPLKVGIARRAVPVAKRRPAIAGRRNATGRNVSAVKLPTALERDTLLTPLWVAETVVLEVERFLNADLPDNFAERLAAKALHLYPRHPHFHKGLNRPGNRGRENLLMFMRHWTAGWLKRERSALYKKLPLSFGNGQRLGGP